jgi:hypothetical protein
MNLKQMVDALNNHSQRPSQRPLLKVAQCRYCDAEFPVQSQDHALARSKGTGLVCGALNCRQRLIDEYNANRRARKS